jgi:D-lactate dehydrogenase
MNACTKYMFNKKLFAIMKKGVYIINTARGGIINTTDLLEAIDNGTVAAAGLDVYENEKPLYFKDKQSQIIEDPIFLTLQNHPQVLMTAHQAFLTNEALAGIATTTIQNLEEWEKSGLCKNEI